MTAKVRLDTLLVERGFAPTRAKAQALILAGLVVVGEHAAEKAGQQVESAADIRLKGDFCPYVSRGGLKLEGALRRFSLDPGGLVCVDVGASTGGFTDCLLQHGAAKVYAIDVGYGQLAWKLREDSRVVSVERQNIRHLPPDILPEPVDLAVVDTSFISLRLVLPHVAALLRPGGAIVALVKPQFEVEKGEVGKGGVVRDPQKRLHALARVCEAAKMMQFDVLATMESPIAGAKKGNIEYLIYLRKS